MENKTKARDCPICGKTPVIEFHKEGVSISCSCGKMESYFLTNLSVIQKFGPADAAETWNSISLESIIKRLNRDNDDLREQIVLLLERAHQVEKEVETIGQKCIKLQVENDELVEKISVLDSDNMELNIEIDYLTSEIDRLSDEI